jgi:hypothetical protein
MSKKQKLKDQDTKDHIYKYVKIEQLDLYVPLVKTVKMLNKLVERCSSL